MGSRFVRPARGAGHYPAGDRTHDLRSGVTGASAHPATWFRASQMACTMASTTLGMLPFLRFGRHGDAGTVENGVGWRTALHQFQELLGERGPARFVLVLDIHEHLAGESPDEVVPFSQRSVIVVMSSLNALSYARRLHHWRRQV